MFKKKAKVEGQEGLDPKAEKDKKTNKALLITSLACIAFSCTAIGFIGQTAHSQLDKLEGQKEARMVNIQATALVGYDQALKNREVEKAIGELETQGLVGQGEKGTVLVQTDGQGHIVQVYPDGQVAETGQIDYQTGNRLYLISWGDTLSELGVKFGYTVRDLADFNRIENPDLIYANSYLALPNRPGDPNVNVWA